MTPVLALPSKGSLYDGTLALFARCGMTIQRDGRGRGYWGRLKHVDDLKVQFLRAEEIPLRVDAGDVAIGLTGFDLYQELCQDSDKSHVLMRSLGFGHARLVVAVPKVWIDVQDINDLREVASEIRQKTGRGLRVGTKFPRAVRKFFTEHSIRDYAIVDSLGATEGMPASGAADAIVDLTSSGSTLVENDLKEISNGTVIASEASLLVSRSPQIWNDETFATLTRIVECLEAGLQAEKRNLINFTIPAEKLPRLLRELVKQCSCEIGCDENCSPDEDERPTGLPIRSSVVCPVATVYAAYRVMREAGATSICVVSPHLMFADSSPSIARFAPLLRKRPER